MNIAFKFSFIHHHTSFPNSQKGDRKIQIKAQIIQIKKHNVRHTQIKSCTDEIKNRTESLFLCGFWCILQESVALSSLSEVSTRKHD